MSLKQKSISGLIWTFGARIGARGLAFIFQIILARIISPSDLGLLGLIMIFNAVGFMLVESGMTSSLIRTKEIENSDYSAVFYLNILISVIIYSIFFIAAPFVADFYEKPELSELIRVYNLAFIFFSLSAVQMAKMTKELNFKTQFYIQLPSVIISGFVGVLLAYLGYGVWSLIFMELVRAAVVAVLYWYFSNWKPDLWLERGKLLIHLDFGYKLTISGIIHAVTTNIIPMIIGKFYPASQVGHFTQAFRMRQFPLSLIDHSIKKVTFPIFAEINDDNEKLKIAYKKVIKTLTALVAPIMFLLIIIAEPLILFLLTEKWKTAIVYFQLLCLSGIIFPLISLNNDILRVKGRSDLVLKSNGIKNLIMIIGVFVTVQYGITWVLFSIIITSVFALFINVYYGGNFINYGLKEQSADLIYSVLPSFIIFVGMWVFIDSLTVFYIPNVLTIVVATIIYMGIYILYHLKARTEEFIIAKELIDSFVSKAQNKISF